MVRWFVWLPLRWAWTFQATRVFRRFLLSLFLLLLLGIDWFFWLIDVVKDIIKIHFVYLLVITTLVLCWLIRLRCLPRFPLSRVLCSIVASDMISRFACTHAVQLRLLSHLFVLFKLLAISKFFFADFRSCRVRLCLVLFALSKFLLSFPLLKVFSFCLDFLLSVSVQIRIKVLSSLEALVWWRNELCFFLNLFYLV